MKFSFFRRQSLVFLTLALAGCSTIRPTGSARPINSLETVTLGGVPQTILIRGDHSDNPLLLFLHGGPGIPELPITHANRELEKVFTVVQWDQRGAGKSFDPALPASKMKIHQIAADTEQLSRYLLRRFNQKNLTLGGFSFGTLIGALAAKKNPEYFNAFVSVSQFVNIDDSERILDREGRERAKMQGDQERLAIMEKIGPPPYKNWKDGATINAVTRELAGHIPHELTPLHYASLALQSPYYSVQDYFNLVKGMKFSWDTMNKEMYEIDLLTEVPRLDVPVYFLQGRRDTVLSAELAATYFNRLIAPKGKHWIWFEHSRHAPHMEEREKYRAVLLEIRKGLEVAR